MADRKQTGWEDVSPPPPPNLSSRGTPVNSVTVEVGAKRVLIPLWEKMKTRPLKPDEGTDLPSVKERR